MSKETINYFKHEIGDGLRASSEHYAKTGKLSGELLLKINKLIESERKSAVEWYQKLFESNNKLNEEHKKLDKLVGFQNNSLKSKIEDIIHVNIEVNRGYDIDILSIYKCSDLIVKLFEGINLVQESTKKQ